MMKSGIIWGGWIVANAPKYIGERGLRLLGKNLKSPYLGLCSNLGAWPPKEICLKNTVEDQDIQWIIAAPVTSFCPISCVVVTWNERISLSCQLHPSLSSRLSESEELIHDWITLLIKTCDTSKSNFSMPLIKSMPWDSVEKSAKRF